MKNKTKATVKGLQIKGKQNKVQNSTNKSNVLHPNFNPQLKPEDPARPLTDIPEPVKRYPQYLSQIVKQNVVTKQKIIEPTLLDLITHGREAEISKWQLIRSSELYEHLELLKAGKLIQLPSSFYKNHSKQPLLSSLESMAMVDMADINKIIAKSPEIYQHNFTTAKPQQPSQLVIKTNSFDNESIEEPANTAYAPLWEIILYPQRFSRSDVDLITDIMPISIAMHALKQCPTTKQINHKISAQRITEYVRSYQLSQCYILPMQQSMLRNVAIYVEHVVVAAQLLGWQTQVNEQKEICFNVSSRCGLFARYPIISDFYINGWV